MYAEVDADSVMAALDTMADWRPKTGAQSQIGGGHQKLHSFSGGVRSQIGDSHQKLHSFGGAREGSDMFFGYDSDEERDDARHTSALAVAHPQKRLDGRNDSYEGLFHRMRELREKAAAGVFSEVSQQRDGGSSGDCLTRSLTQSLSSLREKARAGVSSEVSQQHNSGSSSECLTRSLTQSLSRVTNRANSTTLPSHTPLWFSNQRERPGAGSENTLEVSCDSTLPSYSSSFNQLGSEVSGYAGYNAERNGDRVPEAAWQQSGAIAEDELTVDIFNTRPGVVDASLHQSWVNAGWNHRQSMHACSSASSREAQTGDPSVERDNGSNDEDFSDGEGGIVGGTLSDVLQGRDPPQSTDPGRLSLERCRTLESFGLSSTSRQSLDVDFSVARGASAEGNTGGGMAPKPQGRDRQTPPSPSYQQSSVSRSDDHPATPSRTARRERPSSAGRVASHLQLVNNALHSSGSQSITEPAPGSRAAVAADRLIRAARVGQGEEAGRGIIEAPAPDSRAAEAANRLIHAARPGEDRREEQWRGDNIEEPAPGSRAADVASPIVSTARPVSRGRSSNGGASGLAASTASTGISSRPSSAGPRWTRSRAERRAQREAVSRRDAIAGMQQRPRAGGHGSEIIDEEEEERSGMFAYLAAVMQATDQAAGGRVTVPPVTVPPPSRLHQRPRSARASARGRDAADDDPDGLLSYLTAVMAAADVTSRAGPAPSPSGDHTPSVQQLQLRQLDEMSANLVEDLTDQCAICFEKQEVGQRCACLPCGHRFHTSCIRSWIVTSATCPLCKRHALHN